MRCSRRVARTAWMLALVLAVIAAVSGVVAAEPREASESASGWKDGAEVYAKTCAYCHDQGVAPVIRGRGLPAPLIHVFVRNGLRSMPAFREAEVDDSSLAKLADYVSKN